MKKAIGITAGDPAGIGPEITLKALERMSADDREVVDSCVIFGPMQQMVTEAARLTPQVELTLGSDATWPSISVIDIGAAREPIHAGRGSAETGRLSYLAIEAAVQDAMIGKLTSIVTAPISKEALNLAGYPYAGHTEMLAALSGVAGSCMMLAHDRLRVSHVSTHVALADVPAMVTQERLTYVIDLTIEALNALGIEEPKIAVAALNPHGGEGGLFGREDLEVSKPVVERYRDRGQRLHGPISGDIVFVRAAAGEFDAVIAMYHDQGHIPVKLLGFDVDPETGVWRALSGVNVTLGLPFVRTSVDHGTAFDIAGKGQASPQSLIEAISFARRMTGPAMAAMGAHR